MRLIDADTLKERAIRVSTVKLPHTFFKAVGTREIDKAPTINAEPVKHGEWKILPCGPVAVYGCSVCREHIPFGKFPDEMKYCPNCGAKMDGGKET